MGMHFRVNLFPGFSRSPHHRALVSVLSIFPQEDSEKKKKTTTFDITHTHTKRINSSQTNTRDAYLLVVSTVNRQETKELLTIVKECERNEGGNQGSQNPVKSTKLSNYLQPLEGRGRSYPSPLHKPR